MSSPSATVTVYSGSRCSIVSREMSCTAQLPSATRCAEDAGGSVPARAPGKLQELGGEHRIRQTPGQFECGQQRERGTQLVQKRRAHQTFAGFVRRSDDLLEIVDDASEPLVHGCRQARVVGDDRGLGEESEPLAAHPRIAFGRCGLQLPRQAGFDSGAQVVAAFGRRSGGAGTSADAGELSPSRLAVEQRAGHPLERIAGSGIGRREATGANYNGCALMTHTITLIPGDGIGPEVTAAVLKILAATGVSIAWDTPHGRSAGGRTSRPPAAA